MPHRKAAKKPLKARPEHDLRRAYEHLGRIDILEGALAGSPFRDVSTLAALAEQSLSEDRARDAADLLLAAEHISFAALAPHQTADTARLAPDLKAAIVAEFHGLLQRAEDHWPEDDSAQPAIAALYASLRDQARSAFTDGSYRPALELARAAETLAQIGDRLAGSLEPEQRLAS